jgi:outer membrane protein assembly factor BamB
MPIFPRRPAARATGVRTILAAIGLAAAVIVPTRGQSAAAPPAPGNDWPQWRGPERSGVSRETGLMKQWPSSGPAAQWSANGLGAGYGAVAVKGTQVFVQGLKNRQSVVTSLGRADGKVQWTRPIGSGQENDRGSGPRSTPTVDGDRVFVLTETGDLAALRAQDGTIVWQRNVLREFNAPNIEWLLSESPLVDGDKVIVTPGGRNAGMVALEKTTGKTIWTAKELSDEAGYASPIVADVQGVRIVADVQGVRTVMTLTSAAGVGVRASDGKLMWRNRSAANGTANAATPVFANNSVFYTSSYGQGAALLSLTAQGGDVRAQEVYFTRDMQNHHGGVIAIGTTLYGFHNSILAAMDMPTGKTLWRNRSVGKGALTYADGLFYILSEDNVMGLAEATPTGYKEHGRFSVTDQGFPSWAHPVVAGGRLYVRNQGTLATYDIRGK